jgi:hypothetical protein
MKRPRIIGRTGKMTATAKKIITGQYAVIGEPMFAVEDVA